MAYLFDCCTSKTSKQVPSARFHSFWVGLPIVQEPIDCGDTSKRRANIPTIFLRLLQVSSPAGRSGRDIGTISMPSSRLSNLVRPQCLLCFFLSRIGFFGNPLARRLASNFCMVALARFPRRCKKTASAFLFCIVYRGSYPDISSSRGLWNIFVRVILCMDKRKAIRSEWGAPG